MSVICVDEETAEMLERIAWETGRTVAQVVADLLTREASAEE